MDNMSRRSFVKLTTGLFATLPAVAGGYLLPFAPREAYADDDPALQPQAESAAKAHIVIVRLTEVGFVIMDMDNNKRTPVSGATVSITSRYNQRSATGTTDDEGKLVLDITNLAEPSDNHTYACNASISITCPGMREWRAQIVRLEGGVAYSFPTRTLEEGVPYPALVTFNGWDVLYTQNDFCSSPKNDATQTLRVELENGGQAANVRLTSRDGKTTYVQGTAASNANAGTATMDATGAWLKSGDAGAFPAGGAFSLAYDVGGTTYVADLNLTVSPNADGAEEDATQSEASFSPFNALPGFSKVSLPAGVPLIGGTEIVPALPEFPCNILVDPFGYLQIFIGPSPKVYKVDNGSTEPRGWRTYPRDSMGDYYKKQVAEIINSAVKAGSALSSPGAINQISYSRVFTAKASVQILAAARWDIEKRLVDGMLSAQSTLGFSFAITENFWAGPFPLLVEFDLALRCVISLASVAFRKELEKGWSPFAWESYSFDYTNSGTTITLVFSPSLSVGVGIKGVASVSLQGTFTVILLLGITKPHCLVGLKAAASVVVQLLLFSASFDIWSWEMPKVYDSWDSNAASNALVDGISANSAGTFDSFEHIGESNLAAVAEYTVNTNELDSFASEANNAGDGLTKLDAGNKFDALITAGLIGENGEHELVPYERTTTHPFRDPHASNGLTGGADALYQNLRVTNERYAAFANANGPDEHQATGFGGVTPSVDTVLVQEVLSDPRVQSYVIGGELYTFRLVSVLVDGEPRTRVVAEKGIDGKDAYYVIDSNAFIGPYASRKNLLDYDFAVSVPDPSQPQFAVLVFSSTVPFNPTITVAEVASRVNYYTVFIMQSMGHAQTVYSEGFRDPSFKDWDNWYTYYLSNPWIEYVAHGINATEDGADVDNGAYHLSWTAGALVRRCDKYSPGSILDAGAELNYALFYRAPNAKTRDPLSIKLLWDDDSDPDADWPNPWSHHGQSIFRADVIRHNQYECTLMLCDSEQTHYYIFANPADETPGSAHDCGSYDKRVHLTAWPGANHGSHGPMLCAYDVNEGKGEPDWRLRSAKWSDYTLVFADVGPTGFATSDFAVDASGNFLFFSSSREGSPGYTYDDANNPIDAPEVHEHRIMACRWRDDHFSDPFVFSHVEHPLDQLHVAGEVGSLMDAWNGEPAMCFVSTQILDAAAGKGNLWLTAVPEVSCVTVLDVQVCMPLLSHGVPAEFYVTLRNDGNTFLSGCSLALAEVDHEVATNDQWTRLDFSADSLRESAFNPKDENGNFEDVESDFALSPGKTSVYSVWLPLSEDWEGEMDVTVRTKDATVPANSVSFVRRGSLAASRVTLAASLISAMSEEEQPYEHDGRLPWDPYDTIRVGGEATTDGSALADAPVRYTRKDRTDTTTPDTGGTRTPVRTVTRTTTTKVPNTADTSPSPAAAALAAAGAGLIAYSHRRTHLER